MVAFVILVNQLDQVERTAVTEHIVDFIDQLGIITKTNVLGALQGFAKQAGNIFLLLLQPAGD